MDLLNLLTIDTTLLTPNRRLSAALIKQHQAQQIQQGKKAWQTPDILPFSSWLERTWQDITASQITASPFLLSSQQEQMIWEDILRHSPENDTLLQISQTAELAKSAWDTLQQWQVDIQHPAFQTTEDNIAFQRWATAFKKKCVQHNWITQANLAEKIANAAFTPPHHLIVAGFTEMSPLQKKLFTLCEEKGTQITYYQTTLAQQNSQRIALQEAETEIQTMARWAKSLLDSHSSAPFIGCVIPNLEDKRDQVIRIFSDVFREKNTYNLDYTNFPFNISAGKTLIAYPIIHTVFQLLSLYSGKTTIDTFSNLLRSPFLGDAEKERLVRANFDNQLHNTNQLSISLNPFEHLSCPLLAKRLDCYFETLSKKSSMLPCSEWSTVFMTLLKILGWPGERELNSNEYQIIQHCFLPLLAEYRELDQILPPQTYSSALHFLMRLASTTVFQPQSPQAPIQILGLLEAVELPFDYLWVSGLDDSTWPSPAKPNPFIPYRLQKTLQMPNASPERELAYCKKLTAQLKQSAKQVIFSHALLRDNAELRASALIKTIPEITLEQLTLNHFSTPTHCVFLSRELESFSDDQAPAISSDEVVYGGSHLFKLQSACPFKAFAELRLHAKKIESPTLGLRPQDRGTIIHKTLELLWQELQDLDGLKSYSLESLNNLIHQHASLAIRTLKKSDSRYLQLELNRIKKIIYHWLQLEKSRPYFKVIFLEKEKTAKIGNIEIKLRVDRIDQLDNGQSLIIDYKTGKNNHVKSWFDERPDEPQLPLYCVTNSDTTIAISFAEIHPDSMKIKGISKLDLQVNGIQLLSEIKYSSVKSWDQQITLWQKNLEKLSDDFYQGHAGVDPKNLDETCRYCHLHSLCRVYERRF